GLEDQVKKVTEDVEKKLILQALEKCNGSRTKAAELLGISRKTLFNKMHRLKIEG
ncbi:sigma-54-dependent Fis family transcriptional regulator, partial [bacterium]|nr:sigma-54-dependent Fis family transcriptional regulator [bacterium]